MSARTYRDFISSLSDREVTGGAAYDALVAAVAAENDCELVSCDRRAAPIYERFGVRISLL
jgi:predicted nucleic acid-binding protein